MDKYIKSDLSDGLKLIEIGLRNIVNLASSSKEFEYKIPNGSYLYLPIIKILEHIYPEYVFTYSDKCVSMNCKEFIISVFTINNDLVFQKL
jgi:hypothetical protein